MYVLFCLRTDPVSDFVKRFICLFERREKEREKETERERELFSAVAV